MARAQDWIAIRESSYDLAKVIDSSCQRARRARYRHGSEGACVQNTALSTIDQHNLAEVVDTRGYARKHGIAASAEEEATKKKEGRLSSRDIENSIIPYNLAAIIDPDSAYA